MPALADATHALADVAQVAARNRVRAKRSGLPSTWAIAEAPMRPASRGAMAGAGGRRPRPHRRHHKRVMIVGRISEASSASS
jgi:hypothetical protein